MGVLQTLPNSGASCDKRPYQSSSTEKQLITRWTASRYYSVAQVGKVFSVHRTIHVKITPYRGILTVKRVGQAKVRSEYIIWREPPQLGSDVDNGYAKLMDF